MNFVETQQSIELVLATGEVPLIVGESGIGKTALARSLAKKHQWHLVVVDGNLLKEGEIGGLPTVKTYTAQTVEGEWVEKQTTVYAFHHKLQEIEEIIGQEKEVLLFIDEMNRCEHAVQQELMNLVLNREINGYTLDHKVKILAAMNPSNQYGTELDYQVVEMDAAQENRFVWLNMESDTQQWMMWAVEAGIEPKIIEFIATFPEYLYKKNEQDVRATPRSYERISKAYKLYKEQEQVIPRAVFLNVLKGNVGRVIAEALMSYIEADHKPLISYEVLFGDRTLSEAVVQRIKEESHTRLYLTAINSFRRLTQALEKETIAQDQAIALLMNFLKLYPIDLRVGMMREIKENYPVIYTCAIENESFVEAYFEAYRMVRG